MSATDCPWVKWAKKIKSMMKARIFELAMNRLPPSRQASSTSSIVIRLVWRGIMDLHPAKKSHGYLRYGLVKRNDCDAWYRAGSWKENS